MNIDIETIHNNIINGNRSDAAKLIKKYGLVANFFDDYADWLTDICNKTDEYNYFRDAVHLYLHYIGR